MNSSSQTPHSSGTDPSEPLPPWQTERLARWQKTWELHCVLSATDDEEAEEDQHEPGGQNRDVLPEGLIAPFDTDHQTLKQGAIRLLAEEWTNGARPHVQVLVLGPWGGKDSDRWLIAPYGPFSEPADGSELKTGRDELGLRVLSVWNARIVPTEVLLKSWFIEQAEPNEVADALAVFRHHTGGEPLPLRLRSVVGPPILSKIDPRINYLIEERKALGGIDAHLANERDGVVTPEPVVPPWVLDLRELTKQLQEREMSRAALVDWFLARCFAPMVLKRGGRALAGDGKSNVEVLRVGGKGARVRFSEQVGIPGVYRARVLEDPGNELEGARILSKDGGLLASLKDKISDREFRADDGLLVQFADGSLATLTPEP